MVCLTTCSAILAMSILQKCASATCKIDGAPSVPLTALSTMHLIGRTIALIVSHNQGVKIKKWQAPLKRSKIACLHAHMRQAFLDHWQHGNEHICRPAWGSMLTLILAISYSSLCLSSAKAAASLLAASASL